MDTNTLMTVIGLLISLLTLILGAFYFFYPRIKDFFSNKIEKNVSIYKNELLKVEKLKYFNQFKNENDYFTFAVNDKVYVRNDTHHKISVDQIDLNILSSSVFYKSDIVILQGIYDEKLIIYSVNNGNKKSEMLNFKINVSLTKNIDGKFIKETLTREQIKEFLQEDSIKNTILDGGQIQKIYTLHTKNKLKQLFKTDNSLSFLNWELEEKNSKKTVLGFSISFDKLSDRFFYGGLGAAGGPENGYNILEVSPNMSNKLSVTDLGVSINENSNQDINIVLLAKKSCTLEFNHTLKIKEASIEYSEVKKVNIFVPLYNIQSNIPNQKIFNKLCQNNITNFKYDYGATVVDDDSIKYHYINAYKYISDMKDNAY